MMIIPTILSALAYIAALAASGAVYVAAFGVVMWVWTSAAGYETPPTLTLATTAPTFFAGMLLRPFLRRFDRAWARFADWWTR